MKKEVIPMRTMQRRICLSCGFIIKKSGLFDPKLCIDCETLMFGDEALISQKIIKQKSSELKI